MFAIYNAESSEMWRANRQLSVMPPFIQCLYKVFTRGVKLDVVRIVQRFLRILKKRQRRKGTIMPPPLSCSFDLVMLDDKDFWCHLNMRRSTYRKIVTLVFDMIRDSGHKLEYYVDENNVKELTLQDSILLCIWFLVKSNRTLEEAADLFRISKYRVDRELTRGFSLISKLRDVVIKQPSEIEFTRTAAVIERRYMLRKVVGVLGTRSFGSVGNKRSLTFMTVCDERMRFVAADVTFDVDLSIAFKNSTHVLDYLLKLPHRHFCVGGEDYRLFDPERNNIITPTDETHPRTKTLNESVSNSLNLMHSSFSHLLKRFPKLDCLHRLIPNAIITGAVLHNILISETDIPYMAEENTEIKTMR